MRGLYLVRRHVVVDILDHQRADIKGESEDKFECDESQASILDHARCTAHALAVRERNRTLLPSSLAAINHSIVQE